ncbi:photosystem II assembly protein Psb34 [Argonema antarcticum]|uniref:photosystem II assembly protein Psb34 n=1 Tax=Argonema antarcticum TaxID=2942763 RepID=UPI002012971B|nr:ssl1498 family light-harvesting-like protein [Argonema antarcticum]MCL1473718.1 ssl1498 family light-harvesting-like protein [Argonema antarcticum A004/B2]
MSYITEERGILNNFAKEPKMYFAEYPTQQQQRSYLFQGVAALALLAAVVLTAFAVS